MFSKVKEYIFIEVSCMSLFMLLSLIASYVY
jgi:hypothetical protein